jgi:hypothetical protein
MSTIQPTDAFIINREGKDYKATVDQFAKDINIHVECGGGSGGGAAGGIDEVLAVNNVAGPFQSLQFHKASEDDLPELPDGADSRYDLKLIRKDDQEAVPFEDIEAYLLDVQSKHKTLRSSYNLALNWDAEGPDYEWQSEDDIEVFNTNVTPLGIAITAILDSTYQYRNEITPEGMRVSRNKDNGTLSAETSANILSTKKQNEWPPKNWASLYSEASISCEPGHMSWPNVHIKYDKRSDNGNLETNPVRSIGITPLDELEQWTISDDDYTFEVLSDGTVKGKEYHGDGTKLSGVMPLDISTLPPLN